MDPWIHPATHPSFHPNLKQRPWQPYLAWGLHHSDQELSLAPPRYPVTGFAVFRLSRMQQSFVPPCRAYHRHFPCCHLHDAGGCWFEPVGAGCCLSQIGCLSKKFHTSFLVEAISHRLKLMAREGWPENGLCFGTTPRTVTVGVPTVVLEF